MKRAMRALCLLLCVMLLPLPLAWAQEDSAPQIRVHLKRLNLTDRADLILDGTYTAHAGNGASMAFPRGSSVTVQIREEQLYLFYEGLSLCLGASVRFERHASDTLRSDGIRFEKGGHFYPGHLQLTVEGGMLLPVLTLSVEDYLLGVVPYEMSNSFPLEALKAQAVCARTYALAHVSPSKAWDVVDTTNDQVFKGVNLRDTNAIRAVEETAGMVGMYKGRLANCYYGASNGGQTELVENVWSGRGDWGYYAMTDDPYDLENPESIVRRARLNKRADNLPPDFTAIVASYMAKDMRKQGFEPLPTAFRIDSITGMSLGKPAFGAPSRMMTELTLTFRWSGRKLIPFETPAPAAIPATPAPAGDDTEIYLFATATPTATPSATPEATPTLTPEPTPEPTPAFSEFIPVAEEATVTMTVFPDVVAALGLSISGSDNEILTLIEEPDRFVLEARRYGHGVGMSQRGAQWMAAAYGKSYTDILNFYYPGMELMTVSAGEIPLSTVEPALAESPAPPATPTPRPTLMPVTGEMPVGAYMAKVAHIDDDSSLNLRAEPTTASEIIMRLYKHQPLMVLEVCEDPAWVHVKTDAVEGYVMVSYLEYTE